MPPHPARRSTRTPNGASPQRLDRLEGERRSIAPASGSPDRTLAIGRGIGSLVPRGTVLSLEGGLGAGKTLIAKGVCAGLGVSGEVLSPSFVLAEEYAGVFPVFHFDLYRLESVDEVARVGLFDAIDGRNVVIVEWGDRLPAGSLDADVRILLEITGDRSRAITIEGPGGFLDALEGSIA
ncbi:MAG: tRNA (adenosine(37)-N6)-threonylcarbamoyltransferase complex ATPase subunit type 1 TsaE [Candidatus Krumholzibacteria bacterium]|nr:tRNA (adenosine(37)-N6)-threonylcarbamoyltransferase complex ATPase subunit type 1 TsaE [Candidatus Krumholzibacteria bacterium]